MQSVHQGLAARCPCQPLLLLCSTGAAAAAAGESPHWHAGRQLGSTEHREPLPGDALLVLSPSLSLSLLLFLLHLAFPSIVCLLLCSLPLPLCCCSCHSIAARQCTGEVSEPEGRMVLQGGIKQEASPMPCFIEPDYVPHISRTGMSSPKIVLGSFLKFACCFPFSTYLNMLGDF